MVIPNNKYPHTLFIADLHLHVSDKQLNESFFEFLSNEGAQASALYILGDLFVLWAGDDDDSDFLESVKDALRDVVAEGTNVYLLPGNRDFLLGHDFARATGCALLTDPTVIDLYGRPTLLTHGDNLCGKDTLHKKFRALTGDPKRQKIFFALPLVVRKSLAWLIHGFSWTRNLFVSRIAVKDVVQKEALLAASKHGVDQVIHGHIHVPFISETKYDGKTIRHIVLGAWHGTEGSVLFYNNDGQCELKTLHFSPAALET